MKKLILLKTPFPILSTKTYSLDPPDNKSVMTALGQPSLIGTSTDPKPYCSSGFRSRYFNGPKVTDVPEELCFSAFHRTDEGKNLHSYLIKKGSH